MNRKVPEGFLNKKGAAKLLDISVAQFNRLISGGGIRLINGFFNLQDKNKPELKMAILKIKLKRIDMYRGAELMGQQRLF